MRSVLNRNLLRERLTPSHSIGNKGSISRAPGVQSKGWEEGGECQAIAVSVSYHRDNSMKWSELNLNNLVPLANILRLIVVKLSFVVKGLLSDETKVPCRWNRKTGKFGIRCVEGGQITTAKRKQS